MRRIKYLFILLIVFSVHHLHAQSWSDAVIGTWLSEDGKGRVEIYRSGNTYSGKLSWLKEPLDTDTGRPKLDKENPDDVEALKPLLNKVILKNFVFTEGYWQDGSIYDPESGKTYDCKMWLEGENNLKIKGYWHFIYRIDTWTRIK